MSNYRSSSHVSVYNYPEHLNPFYEDEQHKRLRFWKIKKSNSDNKNGNSSTGLRRGSFNFGSLRDLFPLRSFRIKKQSSALGINMTSESPPPLRRDFIAYNKEDENKYALYDPHFRHTSEQDAFQRNATYRSSLQHMNDLTFNRNNRYRNTIQNGSSMKHISTLGHSDGRYVYAGSITPTPKSRYLTDITPRMTPGSSMNSISTNPFDDDDNDNEENVEGIITANNATKMENSLSSSSKKPSKRKKRRAPPPPNQVVAKGTSEIENVQIRNNENELKNENGLNELSRLTAEFESFVKNSQKDIHEQPKLIIDEAEEITKDDNQKAQEKICEEIEEEKSLNEKKVEAPQVTIEIERAKSVSIEEIPATNEKRTSEHHVVVRRELESADNKTIAIIQEDLKIKEIELKIKEDELRIKEALEEVNNNNNNNNNHNNNKTLLIESKEVDENLNCEREEKVIRESTPDIQTLEVHQKIVEIRKYPEIQRITPSSTPSREQTPDFIPLTVREKFDVLRIDENENDIQMPEDIKEEKSLSNMQIQEIKVLNTKERSPSPIKEIDENEIFKKVTYTKALSQSNPVHETRIVRDRTPIPLARTEIESKLSSQGFVRVEKPIKYDDFERCVVRRTDSQNDEDVVLRGEDGAPKVPERRRSVKDIIESINRQQQKLKINQPQSPQLSRKHYYFGEQKFSYHEKPALPPKENVLLKLQRQAENEKRINALLEDLQDFTKENAEIQRTQKFPVTERDTNNNSSYPHQRNSRDDINPIPKPRRII